MAKCDVCGNDYDKSFQITSAGKTRTFDSFECAIHMLAPTCPHCNCRVVGHGVEAGGEIPGCRAHQGCAQGQSLIAPDYRHLFADAYITTNGGLIRIKPPFIVLDKRAQQIHDHDKGCIATTP